MLYINRLTKKLDKHYSWRIHTTQRTLLQILTGLVFPALLAFYLAAIYFRVFFDISIHDTVYLEIDYLLVVLLLIVANIYYLCYYLWFIPPSGFVPLSHTNHAKGISSRDAEENHKTVFLAQTSDKTIAIPMEHIAAIYIEGNYVLLRTLDKQTYTIINQSLAKAMDELNGRQFFRINPRFIVNYKLCREHQKGKNSNRELILGAPLNRTETITRSRIQEFNEWLVR